MFLANLQHELQSIHAMILAIHIILNFMFAGAIARDVGRRHKQHQGTFLVSGFTWAFATLLGGVVTVAIYWLIHYSKFRGE